MNATYMREIVENWVAMELGIFCLQNINAQLTNEQTQIRVSLICRFVKLTKRQNSKRFVVVGNFVMAFYVHERNILVQMEIQFNHCPANFSCVCPLNEATHVSTFPHFFLLLLFFVNFSFKFGATKKGEMESELKGVKSN